MAGWLQGALEVWYNRISWLLAWLLRRDLILISDHDGKVFLRHVIWVDGYPHFRYSTNNLWRLQWNGAVNGPSFVQEWQVIRDRSGNLAYEVF